MRGSQQGRRQYSRQCRLLLHSMAARLPRRQRTRCSCRLNSRLRIADPAVQGNMAGSRLRRNNSAGQELRLHRKERSRQCRGQDFRLRDFRSTLRPPCRNAGKHSPDCRINRTARHPRTPRQEPEGSTSPRHARKSPPDKRIFLNCIRAANSHFQHCNHWAREEWSH